MDGTIGIMSADWRSDELPVRRFALRVVSELVHGGGRRMPQPNAHLMALMLRFAQHGEGSVLGEIFSEMTRRSMPAEDILDIYLPRTVQVIGGQWHDDQIDVLEASLGFARLQGLLRELGRAWVSDRVGNACDGRVLLMLPRCEQHTLGAMFAANQLRRMGVSVKVMLAPGADDLKTVMAHHQFHGVFLSVSNISSLSGCAALIRDLRACDARGTPVIVGGGLVSSGIEDMHPAGIAEKTGADIVTSDIACALHFCGLQQFSVAAA